MKFYSNVNEVKTVGCIQKRLGSFFVSDLLPFDKIFFHTMLLPAITRLPYGIS